VQHLLAGPSRPGTLLGTSEHAIWIASDDDVLVLSDREAVRLPNAVEFAVDDLGHWIDGDDAVLVGDGIVQIGWLTVTPRRWFDPRPSLSRCTVSDLARTARTLPENQHALATADLVNALASENEEEALQSASLLLGRGEGLTPEGDDILAGALASFRLLGNAVGKRPWFLDSLEAGVAALTRTRTTSFSGALVRHALHGRVARPFAGALHALTGRGDIASSIGHLLSVGSSSGPALVAGLAIGSSAITLEHAQ